MEPARKVKTHPVANSRLYSYINSVWECWLILWLHLFEFARIIFIWIMGKPIRGLKLSTGEFINVTMLIGLCRPTQPASLCLNFFIRADVGLGVSRARLHCFEPGSHDTKCSRNYPAIANKQEINKNWISQSLGFSKRSFSNFWCKDVEQNPIWNPKEYCYSSQKSSVLGFSQTNPCCF